MKTRIFAQTLVLLIMGGFLLTSCLLPGMIPLNPESTAPAGSTEPAGLAETSTPSESMPTMETDSNVVLESLQAREGVYLASLAKEQYSDQDAAQPGTLTYTVEITDDKPTYFNYGWCTTTEEILLQNFEHIKIGFYFNGRALPRDVVHTFQSQSQINNTDMVCLNFVTLMSNWPEGEYQLTAVATFDEQINDGLADFDTGDYIHEYNVTVNK
jgi:hypothetical protein